MNSNTVGETAVVARVARGPQPKQQKQQLQSDAATRKGANSTVKTVGATNNSAGHNRSNSKHKAVSLNANGGVAGAPVSFDYDEEDDEDDQYVANEYYEPASGHSTSHNNHHGPRASSLTIAGKRPGSANATMAGKSSFVTTATNTTAVSNNALRSALKAGAMRVDISNSVSLSNGGGAYGASAAAKKTGLVSPAAVDTALAIAGALAANKTPVDHDNLSIGGHATVAISAGIGAGAKEKTGGASQLLGSPSSSALSALTLSMNPSSDRSSV